MTLPTRIAAQVSGGDLVLPVDSQAGECEGSKFHSPTPMMVHKVALLPEQWKPHPPAASGHYHLLCGTCRDNYLFLCEVFKHYNGVLPAGMAKEIGNLMRALVREAWAYYRGGGSVE